MHAETSAGPRRFARRPSERRAQRGQPLVERGASLAAPGAPRVERGLHARRELLAPSERLTGLLEHGQHRLLERARVHRAQLGVAADLGGEREVEDRGREVRGEVCVQDPSDERPREGGVASAEALLDLAERVAVAGDPRGERPPAPRRVGVRARWGEALAAHARVNLERFAHLFGRIGEGGHPDREPVDPWQARARLRVARCSEDPRAQERAREEAPPRHGGIVRHRRPFLPRSDRALAATTRTRVLASSP
ncbi:MAG: hypothetical protein KF901_01440 [Myxococcales bacterium]|nr:hypothetical protein [Myxococcales bacterium]